MVVPGIYADLWPYALWEWSPKCKPLTPQRYVCCALGFSKGRLSQQPQSLATQKARGPAAASPERLLGRPQMLPRPVESEFLY